MLNKSTWIAALKTVATDKVALIAKLKEVAVTLTVQPSILPQRGLVKVGTGEPLVDVLDRLSDFASRHVRAGRGGAVQIVYDLENVDWEALTLIAVELGLAAQCPVVTVPENGSWLVLFDPNDRIRPGTVITDKPDGWDPQHQSMQQRLRVGMYSTDKDIPVHADDKRYQDEKAGLVEPRLTLRQMLEKLLIELE